MIVVYCTIITVGSEDLWRHFIHRVSVHLVCICYVRMYGGISLHLCASPITVVKAVLFISGYTTGA